MSVLIKGMEMPKNCDECRIMVFEDTNCVPELFCGCPIVFKAHPQGVGHRPDYCPLVEVPKHGRLIDADEFIKGHCNLCDGACENTYCDCLSCKETMRCDMIQDFSNAPTVIESEEA